MNRLRVRSLRCALALAARRLGCRAVPALARAAAPPPHYLVFTGTYGFRHDGIQEAVAEIQRQAAETRRVHRRGDRRRRRRSRPRPTSASTASSW